MKHTISFWKQNFLASKTRKVEERSQQIIKFFNGLKIAGNYFIQQFCYTPCVASLLTSSVIQLIRYFDRYVLIICILAEGGATE